MSKIFLGVIIVAIVIVLVLVGLMLKYRKEGKILKEEQIKGILYKLAYYAVCISEAIYKDGNGKKKLDEATKTIRKKLPADVADLISDEMIHQYIEKALDNLQIIFKGKKEDMIYDLTQVIDVGHKTNNLQQTLNMAEAIRSDKGYIKGYGEAQVGKDGKPKFAVGAEIGKTF